LIPSGGGKIIFHLQ